MHLKNPFGMRNGKIVMIRDITTAERGAKCNCICPLCQAHFIAKLGDIRQPHFAHDGKPCNFQVAVMTAVYQLMFEALQENPNFVYPAHYGEYTGVSLEHKASLQDIKRSCSFYTQKCGEDDECIIQSGTVQVNEVQIHKNGKGVPDALILTKAPAHKLALILVPPESLCKTPTPAPFQQLPTVAVFMPQDLYMIRSEEIKSVLCTSADCKQWVSNAKIDKWLQGKLKLQNEAHSKRLQEIENERAKRLADIAATKERIQREAEEKARQQNLLTEKAREAATRYREHMRDFPTILKNKYHQLPDKPVTDTFGNDWYYCMLCNQWYPATQMAIYGGQEEGCRGTCSVCGRHSVWHL